MQRHIDHIHSTQTNTHTQGMLLGYTVVVDIVIWKEFAASMSLLFAVHCEYVALYYNVLHHLVPLNGEMNVPKKAKAPIELLNISGLQ